jgi:cobalt-zinc-cadmium efflux system protein
MEHRHHDTTPGRLLISILLNVVLFMAELIGGIFSNSLALISDAIHNFSDVLALALSYATERLGRKCADEKRTFGYKRFEILSAFVNSAALAAISLYLIYEAIVRLWHPEPVHSGLMFAIAGVALPVNLGSMFLLHRHSNEKLNIRAAYLHLAGDALTSAGVLAGAVLIYLFNIPWIDPILTLLIGIAIIVQAYRIIRQSVDILVQSTPAGINLAEIKSSLEGIPGVRNIHHLHCWQLHDQNTHFEAHVETESDFTLSECNALRAKMEKILAVSFTIRHTTLQFEYACCDDKEMIRNKDRYPEGRKDHR